MELAHIKDCIHEVRGMKVMLDVDLARIYQVETRVLNRRNVGILIAFQVILCLK